MGNEQLDITHSAAVVCPHVAMHGLPILFGRRDEPAFPEDSGWQFTCGAAEHGEEPAAKLWSVNDVLRAEPSLRGYILCPENTELARQNGAMEWRVANQGVPLVKVIFVLGKDAPFATEGVWAEMLEPAHYRIDNIPFFIRDVSPDDVVEAVVNNGELQFSRIIERSRSTVLWAVVNDADQLTELRQALEELGCTCEGGIYSGQVAIEVPSDVTLETVTSFLDTKERRGLVRYETASLRHPAR